MVALAAVILASAWLSGGCSRPSGSSPAAAAGEQDPWRKTALWVDQGEQPRPITNGQAIAVGEVTVEVFVAPYPPQREGSIDIYVRDRATGKPVEGNAVRIAFDMYMPHGNIGADVLPTGGGHFLVPYKLVMPGEWRADIAITRGGSMASLAVIFRVE